MENVAIYSKLKRFLIEEAEKANILEETVMIKGRVLSNKEAIGTPKRQDFPLLKGKEKLLQAEFKGFFGQAFTDSPGTFQGTLRELLEKPVQSNFEKASFIAVLNAVMRYLGKTEGTIHCKNEEPTKCAEKLVDYIKQKHGVPKIGMIGLQPAILEACQKSFPIRVVDLDLDNIGQKKCGVVVENGETDTKDVIEWCDLVLATGSTVANGSITDFLDVSKPTIFYGTTIAGAAPLLNVERFCAFSK